MSMKFVDIFEPTGDGKPQAKRPESSMFLGSAFTVLHKIFKNRFLFTSGERRNASIFLWKKKIFEHSDPELLLHLTNAALGNISRFRERYKCL